MYTSKKNDQKCYKENNQTKKGKAKRIARFLIPKANENWLLYK